MWVKTERISFRAILRLLSPPFHHLAARGKMASEIQYWHPHAVTFHFTPYLSSAPGEG